MTVRPRTFLIGLALIIIVGFGILLFPLVSDPDRVKTIILQELEAGLGRKIEVAEAKFEFFPRPHLELAQVVIRDVNTAHTFLKANRIDLVLRSTPLLRMQVVVKRLRIEHPQIVLRRNRTGQWNVLTPGAGNAEPGTTLGKPLGLVMLVQDTTLTEGRVTVVDEFRPDGIRTIEMTDLDIAVMTQPHGVPMDIRVAGKITSGLDTSTVSLTGTVTSNPGAAGQTGNTRSPTLQFQGMVDLGRVDLRQMMDFFGPRPLPDRVHGTANLQSRIRLVPGMSGYDMALSDLKASVGSFAVAGQASLSGIMTPQPTFSMTVSATPASLDDLLSRFPSHWLPVPLQDLVAERDINGTVQVVKATVTGSTTPTPHASVTGEFRIQHGQALLGQNKVPAKNLAGTVLIDPDRVRVSDITGEYGPLQLSTGKLAIVFLEQGPSLDLDVSGTIAASDLVRTLATSIESPPISRPLGRLRDVQGQARVTFQLKGLLNQPEGLTVTGAEIRPKNVQLASSEFREPVTELNGRLVYSQSAVRFDEVGGLFGQAQFQLSGTILTGDAATFQDFSAWTRAPSGQVLSLLSMIRSPRKSALQGPMSVALTLTGPVASPQMKGLVEFNDASLSVPGWLLKPAGQPAVLEFDAALSSKGVITAPRIDLIMPPIRLSGKATIRPGKILRISSSLVSGPIPLAGLPPGMVIGGLNSGTLEVSLDVRGRGNRWNNWRVTGWVAVTDGRFAGKAADHPVTDIYLRTQLTRAAVDVKRLEFRIDDSFVRVSGTIRDWRKKAVITASVESPHLDFDLLVPTGRRSPARDVLEDLAATSRVSATFSVTRGRYKQLILSDMSSQVTLGDDTLAISRIDGRIEDGTITESRVVVRLPRGKPAEGEVKLQVAGLPADKILELIGDDQRLITGNLALTASLQGNERHPRGIANTLTGNLDIRIDQGHIEKGTVVPKILMILDIPSRLQGKVDLEKEGMPFDRFSGTLALANGIVTTKNLLIDSPVIKISGAGTYVIPADELDVAVVVSPFGSYTKLLQGIPLFGRLLAGERKGFTTAFFDVKGSLKDPQVINRPMKSVGAGLTGLGQLAFDVLRNTLMLPAEIFSPGQDKIPPPNTKIPSPSASTTPSASP